MHRLMLAVAGRFVRVVSLVCLSVLGASAFMYTAPGYFTDSAEMDGVHSATTRLNLRHLQETQSSLGSLLVAEARDWCHGDLGYSRQFGTGVAGLIKERAQRSAVLLCSGVVAGWSFALLLALPLSLRKAKWLDAGAALFTSMLLALPVGVVALACLISNFGGPVLVLAVVIAAKDLKVLDRVLGQAWNAPHVVHARSCGLPYTSILRSHIAPNVRAELAALALMSFTLALSALVPVEVIFDAPGLGHLAWSAATNRDLPVLAATTAIMSACVGVAGSLADYGPAKRRAACV